MRVKARSGRRGVGFFAAAIALSSVGHADPASAPTGLSPFTGEPLPPNGLPVQATPAPPPAVIPPSSAAPVPPAPSGTWVPAPDGRTYVQVPAGYQAPLELPYRKGEPVPAGYRLVEEPVRGLVISGYLLTGIGYGIGLLGAAAADFANQSSWMFAPVFGPWLTLGTRDYADCSKRDEDNDGTNDYNAECTQDALVVSGLIMDGLMQGAGATLLLAGYLAKQKKLIREDIHVGIAPGRVEFGMYW